MITKLENDLEKIFVKKLPELPKKVKEVIVIYGPYLTVVLLVLSIPTILALIGIIIATTPFAFLGGVKGFDYIISILLGLIMMGLQVVAIPGLFKRKIKSWRLLFYISLINALLSLVKFDLGGLIIGAGISWYILFQIKSYYK